MGYRVEIAPAAERQLRKLEKAVQARLASAMRALADDPMPRGARKLSGLDLLYPLYRIREGDYRIIYEIHRKVLRVLIVKIGHRREVYRG